VLYCEGAEKRRNNLSPGTAPQPPKTPPSTLPALPCPTSTPNLESRPPSSLQSHSPWALRSSPSQLSTLHPLRSTSPLPSPLQCPPPPLILPAPPPLPLSFQPPPPATFQFPPPAPHPSSVPPPQIMAMTGNKVPESYKAALKTATKGQEAANGGGKLWVAPATPVTRWRPLNTEDLGNYLEKPRECTVQYSTVQYSTGQYSTVQLPFAS